MHQSVLIKAQFVHIHLTLTSALSVRLVQQSIIIAKASQNISMDPLTTEISHSMKLHFRASMHLYKK